MQLAKYSHIQGDKCIVITWLLKGKFVEYYAQQYPYWTDWFNFT